jgi:hypothetical protein
MYPARNRAKLCHERFVLNNFLSIIHVARPARSHRDSSLLAHLKESDGGYPDGEKDEQPERARRAGCHKRKSEPGSRQKRDRAHHATLALLTRPYV